MFHIRFATTGKRQTYFNVFDCSSSICVHSSFHSTRWHSNRYVNGAYSYISTECDNNDTIPQHLLGQPLTIDDFDFENDSTTERNSGMDTAMPAKQSSPTNSVPKLPIVLFAGEACHVKYFSTAHGAFVSGFEQAQKIIKFYE